MGPSEFSYLFACVYRVNGAPPPADIDVQLESIKATLVAGPISVVRTVFVDLSGPGCAGGTVANQEIEFPAGSYLFLLQRIFNDGLGEEQANARIRNSEVAATCDVSVPGWLVEKVFEGPICEPGTFAHIPEGPMTITSWPSTSQEEAKKRVLEAYTDLASMSEDDRNRFRLMARWYRRALESHNQIDRFLFFYFALEVFPAKDTSDVPRAISQFLSSHVLGLPREQIKTSLELGRITGMRASIVHDGRSVVNKGEWQVFRNHLMILESLAHECMRVLLGKPYSGRLDRWLHPRMEAKTTP
jgi:hypothetical protein